MRPHVLEVQLCFLSLFSMNKLIKRHHTAAIFCILAVFALASCTADTSLRSRAEAFIDANISELSTRSATLGGTFRVTDVEWVDDNTVLVSYEDGHIALKGRAKVVSGQNGKVLVTNFRIANDRNDDDENEDEDEEEEDEDENEDEDDSEESSSSTSTMMEESSSSSSY